MGQSSQTDESHCHLDPARRLEASERLLGTAIHESIDGTSAPRGSGGLQGVERFHEAPQQWNEHGQLQDSFDCEPTRSIGRATSELQSLMRISYPVFCLQKKKIL